MSNHNVISVALRALRCTCVAALVALPGCDDGVHPDAATADGSSLSADERDYVADLAWRYLEQEVSDEEARQIDAEIAALSRAQMRLMNKELQLLGDADSNQARLGDGLTELAIERGVPMFALGQEDIDRVAAELGAGVSSRAFCETWSPSPAVSMSGFNSASAGTTASWTDRRSTNWYEYGGCDHRFYFSGKRTLIDGKSTAYDKWIASYPSILAQRTYSSTIAVMGNYRAEAAGIYNVSASMVKAF
ncbi:MAG TPA: hypothetical protein VGB85_23685 [Nannocystis sp.]